MRSRWTGSVVWCTTCVLVVGTVLAVAAAPSWAGDAGPADPKSLSGSYVLFDPSAGGDACWSASTTQTFCFEAVSFTDDWEYVENLWLLLPSDWTVSDVTVTASSCANGGSFGSFSWTFQTPSYEIDIDQRRSMNSTDQCTAVYCVEATTGAGSGDALVSWYWDGDEWDSAPHWPCSDDGYTPAGQSACDESVQPRAAIPDCSSFGALEGTIHDSVTSGPTCTGAVAVIDPGGVTAPADGAGAYGPVYLTDGSYDVTGTAQGFDDDTVTGVAVVAGGATTLDLYLERPVLDATPTSFETTVTTGSSDSEILGLANQGVTPELDWSIGELPPTETVNPMSSPSAPGPVVIEPALADQLRAGGEVGYLIDLRERPDLGPALTMPWRERGRYVVEVLRATADRTQARVRAYLDDHRVSYQAFWIDNMIVVEASSREVVDGLLAFGEIEMLRADRVLGVIEPVERAAAGSDGRAVEANIGHVHADDVWALGFDGDGMVVANIDTGVRHTHEVLEPHYRGNLGGGAFDHDYNWLSGDGGSATPVDGHGHGTHTMGTMVGDDGGANQVGMAPGATWIACEGCPGGSCPSSALLTCAQWIAAPYPVGNPSAPNPDMRPQVVNNSWGDCGTSYDGWYQGSVDSWHAAGIYPVFSNGNASNCGYSSPPGCNTVGNPARYGNVTGVGSTGQSNGAYATHSNWGPTDNADTVNPAGFPSIKPQVAAPGVSIRSSLSGSDSDYGSWAGTSMSAPHVGGLIALMWQAAPCLIGDYAQTETIIQSTAVTIPYTSGCGGEGPGDIPNMATGWGEIDAMAAVTEATLYCNTDWLPWVSEAPDAGTVAAGGAEDVTLTFSCGPDPGQETGTLRLVSNDPCATTLDIPLTLHCEALSGVDLALTKTDGAATAVPGTSIGYTIVVSNAGPDDAVGATVTDTLQAALTGATWTCAAAGGASCTPSGSGSISDTVDVPIGGTLTYTITATIDPAATGDLSNTADVAEPAGVTDLDPNNNAATDTTTLTPQTDLATTKTDGLGVVMPGDPVTYTIAVSAAGPSDAPGATVTDAFPANVSGVTWSCLASGGASCTASGSGDLSDTVSLPAGGSVTYTATGALDPSATGVVSNTATATPPAGVTDVDPANDSATDTTTVAVMAELHAHVSNGVCWVLPGDATSYTLAVVNDGPGDAMGALVDDSPSVWLTGATWTCVASGGAACPASGAGAISEAVDLPAGTSVEFTLSGTVDPAATGLLINEATVTAPPDAWDPTPGNAWSSDWDALEPPVFCDDLETGGTGAWSRSVP